MSAQKEELQKEDTIGKKDQKVLDDCRAEFEEQTSLGGKRRICLEYLEKTRSDVVRGKILEQQEQIEASYEDFFNRFKSGDDLTKEAGLSEADIGEFGDRLKELDTEIEKMATVLWYRKETGQECDDDFIKAVVEKNGLGEYLEEIKKRLKSKLEQPEQQEKDEGNGHQPGAE